MQVKLKAVSGESDHSPAARLERLVVCTLLAHHGLIADAVSAAGNINLVNEDLAVLQADYAKLHEIVELGLFSVSSSPAVPAALASEDAA